MLLCWHLMKSVMAGELDVEYTECLLNIVDYFRIILDADPSSVQKRVDLRNDELPLGEQTVAQVTNALHGLFW